MNELHFVDAQTDEHFRAMSLIHAMGWRDTYDKALTKEFLDNEITDDRWVDTFRGNYQSGNVHGLLLYRGDTPVSCINYCQARLENFNPGNACRFNNENYRDWGEIASFYTHPDERSKGYGGILFEEALRRLKALGFENAFVFVLRENAPARRFYERHGFKWDGTHVGIPFPGNVVCVDLRYVRGI